MTGSLATSLRKRSFDARDSAVGIKHAHAELAHLREDLKHRHLVEGRADVVWPWLHLHLHRRSGVADGRGAVL